MVLAFSNDLPMRDGVVVKPFRAVCSTGDESHRAVCGYMRKTFGPSMDFGGCLPLAMFRSSKFGDCPTSLAATTKSAMTTASFACDRFRHTVC